MKGLISHDRGQLVCVPADELAAKNRVVAPLDRTVDVTYCQGLRVRQRRDFQRLDRAIGPFEVVLRGMTPLEKRAVEGDVA